MRKIFLIAFAIFFTIFVYAQKHNYYNEISAKDLPKTSRNIITKYFGGLSMVDMAEKWPNNYSAELKNGQKLNFYLDGKIKEAKSNGTPLPVNILSEFPKEVLIYIKNNYGSWNLMDVGTDENKIEVKLKQGDYNSEVKFSKSGELLKDERNRHSNS